MRLRPSSLRGRLAAWYVAVLATTLVAFAAAVYFLVAEDDDDEAPPPAGAALSAEPPEHTGRRVLVAVAVALPGAVIVAVAGGFWITRRSLRPLDDIARVASELGAAKLDRRVELPPDAATELRQLGDTLNRMLERIERSVKSMRRFTEDASHELRTPLAALRGELEVTLRRPRSSDELRAGCESALEEVERLSELVEALLTLARSDAGELLVEPKRVDLVEIIRRVVAPYEAVAVERGVTLELVCDACVDAMGDPIWLERVIANLVDNACKLTPRGGRVRVEGRDVDGRARVIVRDSGPGVPPEDADKIFARFYRGSAARATEGFGLGLALAHDLVRALGGTIATEPTEGGGATFRIDLPRG
ncbi:MAG: HAMP domain-containing protein [Myxococcales bacterium]|nr:HAMP domain-containing protein [Myxococcales bacterium]